MKKTLKLIKDFLTNKYTNVKYLKEMFYFYNRFKNDTIFISGTGVMIILKKDSVIKIPLGDFSKNELSKEYNNYLLLKDNILLKKYVDYRLKKRGDFYFMDKLLIPTRIKYKDILSDLNKAKVYSNTFINLSLINLNNWCNLDFKYKFFYEKSVMHGDFTPSNIMQNSKGQYVLIDLNRFTFNGIKGIDEIHFKIEEECKKENIDFFDWIDRNFDEFSDKNMLFIYFIYRINVEHNDDIILPKIYYKKACTIYKKFRDFFL